MHSSHERAVPDCFPTGSSSKQQLAWRRVFQERAQGRIIGNKFSASIAADEVSGHPEARGLSSFGGEARCALPLVLGGYQETVPFTVVDVLDGPGKLELVNFRVLAALSRAMPLHAVETQA